MKNIAFILSLVLASCQSAIPEENWFQVHAQGETEPVRASADRDAADDPAIWVNPNSPENSLILGSDKTLGIDLYNLSGKRLFTDSIGRINNIDLRPNYPWGDSAITIIGGSHRDSVGMAFWMLSPEDSSLHRLTSSPLPSHLPDVYGFCLYQSPIDQAFYAFVNSKTGAVEQWLLQGGKGDPLRAEKVRTLKLPTQVEGMVADDASAAIFVGVEELGVFRFDAEPNGDSLGQFVPFTGEINRAIAYDVEGLALYAPTDTSGYLVLSSQGNNSFAVFQRFTPFTYMGSFIITDSLVDGVQETDGIEITSANLGPGYPDGLMVVQDGSNWDGDSPQPQNFKWINWSLIKETMQLK